jgi:hypothetical protein
MYAKRWQSRHAGHSNTGADWQWGSRRNVQCQVCYIFPFDCANLRFYVYLSHQTLEQVQKFDPMPCYHVHVEGCKWLFWNDGIVWFRNHVPATDIRMSLAWPLPQGTVLCRPLLQKNIYVCLKAWAKLVPDLEFYMHLALMLVCFHANMYVRLHTPLELKWIITPHVTHGQGIQQARRVCSCELF